MGWKSILYEAIYLKRALPIHRLILISLTIVSSIIISYSDTKSFFTNEDSPIPSWKFLEDPKFYKIISVFIISSQSILTILTEKSKRSEEMNLLAKITKDTTLPYFEKDIDEFLRNIKEKFELSANTRIYVVMPLRKGILNWRLEIVSKTFNVERKELKASLRMDEGIIGYAFQNFRIDSPNTIKYIPFKSVDCIPPGYKHISNQNKNLVKNNINGYLLAASFERNITSLLIIDSTDLEDINLMSNESLHQAILHWVDQKNDFLNLLWRLKNHGS